MYKNANPQFLVEVSFCCWRRNFFTVVSYCSIINGFSLGHSADYARQNLSRSVASSLVNSCYCGRVARPNSRKTKSKKIEATNTQSQKTESKKTQSKKTQSKKTSPRRLSPRRPKPNEALKLQISKAAMGQSINDVTQF